MIGKISEKPEIILGLKTIKKRKKISRVDSNLGKVVTAAVGFLAASQGLEGAAARPGAKLNGLAEPLAQRGVSNSRTLASAGSPPNNALAKSGVAPAPALTYDISTISEAPAPGVNNVVSGNGSRPMQTWIVNKSNVDLIATTSYNCFSDCSSNSTFIDHPIPQRTEDVDQYCQQHQFFNFTTEHLPSETNPLGLFCPPSVSLQLRWSAANSTPGNFTLEPDKSVIVANMGYGTGLNVYQSIYGDLSTPNGSPLGQIYGNSTTAG